ncbi:DUF397 domain-containing protein [Streptomyces aurantiacus]|uniref:DUF397 domain-containing protein n=1 Tax=Streptomyces aurantiacus JA 4570 TaxID=1286094 RepID=S3ZN09_9ACTN|nr:DUF397 domain-containing protein [Streptomyces aurantiacus]EPH44568.1 hypothetical protein STRAU_2367 [Streptomyces aurantiacus JA 4570]
MSTPELAWFKSSYSGTQGDSCVEVAATPALVHVRDSKEKAGPQLALSPAAWTRFLAGQARP